MFYCSQFYNKGIVLKFPSSFSSSTVEIFRPLTPSPTSCFITNIYHFIHRCPTRLVGCCGCCHPARRLGNACPEVWGMRLGCSQDPVTSWHWSVGIAMPLQWLQVRPIYIIIRIINNRHAVASHSENVHIICGKKK